MKQLMLFDLGPDATIDKMIFLEGSSKSFHCDCGCNVFREFEYRRFRCNSCLATYTGN